MIAVTGAKGLIGKALLPLLLCKGAAVRAFIRKSERGLGLNSGVQYIDGDFSSPSDWAKLLEPGCILIHLAYSGKTPAKVALEETRVMIEACAAAGIKRLVHCSSVAVFGQSSESDLNENSKCRPSGYYANTKLAIERMILSSVAERFETVIVRPTSIVGEGGETLLKLISDLTSKPRWMNYLRSCLFNGRPTHLISIDSIVLGLWECSSLALTACVDVVILSNDEDPLNNFRCVEAIVMKELGLPSYPWPPIRIPVQILKIVLFLMGRGITNPSVRFVGSHLSRRCLSNPRDLKPAIKKFVRSTKNKVIRR